jgi:hypothetical protein
MPDRDPALLDKLGTQIDDSRRLFGERGETGPERNGFTDRPWRGDDTLIMKARASVE